MKRELFGKRNHVSSYGDRPSLKKAITNRRAIGKTITKMEKLSRPILFESNPDTIGANVCGGKF
ncbi:MAG TPA: hypothetical protein VK633_02030 [Verrucomicrobiae bacterium]|nr:hypothetical protein [Verrucomicrobiae bacterium]